ncbi:MAG TPA: tetratricopeptide repeat protein [Rhizomicrobium sp.]
MKVFGAAFAVASFLIATPASASVVVIGSDAGYQCYLSARFNLDPTQGIDACNHALLAPLSRVERAGTHVNRGVMEVALEQEDKALADFDLAIAENPKLGDGYLNRGAMLVNLKRFGEARDDILQGIALGPTMPEVGYYDLGVVEQALGHDEEALTSFRKALSLAPYFQPAVHALENFSRGPLPIEIPV